MGMTIREVATLLGIRLGSVYSLVWGGALKATKTDGAWLVDRGSVEAYQAQRNARRERILRSHSRHRTIDVQAVVQPEVAAVKGGAT